MINFLKIRGVLVLVCLLLVADGVAQNFSQHNWYFGNGVQGIRFSRTDNSPSLVTNQFTPFGAGGSAVATDPTNANVLFYTDGSRVLNIAHAQMSNGFGLNANTSANQPVAICGVPGQPNQYLIFTNNASFTVGGTISVTTVDMTAFGSEPFPTPPLGNVLLPLNTPTGLTGRSEGMITVPHANGTDFWLITHENGTDNYTATLVAAGPAFTHTTFPNVTGLPISAANFSYHEASGKIAVSAQTIDRNVAILNFDNVTGTISFDQFVLNSAVTSTINQANYDTEWSSNGQFLYISRHGEAGIAADVVQFDLNNPGVSLASVLPLTPPFTPDRSYGLQMAPDSAIYHLYQLTPGGPFLVGRLTNTDSVAASVVYTQDALGAGLDFSGTQFPSFLPRSTLNLSVSFITDGTCSNSPISFYPFVTPTADSLVWDFGDGQGSNQWSPIYTYQSGGTFNVTVTAFLNGQTAIGNGVVNLTQFDLQLTLVQDTTACECELPVNNGIPPCPNDTSDDFSVTVQTPGGSPTSFTWSNGDTGPALTPDSAGYYYVVVTDVSGCTAYAGVNVREYDAIDQRANIWYFGQNAGINFNTPPGTTAITGPVNTPEGVSVISDRNGQVIFSTDGVNVYDRNDDLVATNIGGDQDATQSALIVPVPGDETLYYIFTTQEVHGSNSYELRYSLYDIKLNAGDGGLAEINQLLFSRSTERITGNGNWLIAHEYGNNAFRAYPITGTGIGNPVISTLGSDHLITDELNGRGYMELGGQNQIAVALASTGVSNFLEFFDFDNTTGAITNFRSVDLNSTAEQVYGVEFVGNKVFATLQGIPNSFLREVYFDFQGNPVLIPPLVPPLGEISAELGAIQTGSDGQVYVAVNNQAFLGTIQVNGDTLQLSNFTLNGFPLAGSTQSRLGLPNFIQSIGTAPQQASMAVAGLCLGDSTNFSGIGTDPIDQFVWSFGDGFGATTQNAQHLYGAAGPYTVTLRVTNRCGLDTLIIQDITIVDPPADPTFLPLGQQPVLCTGTLTLEAEPAIPPTGNTYVWSTGETTRTIVVTQQSLVSVTITNAQGCTSNGAIIVADNRPQVNLGPDQILCQNTPVAPLDAQNPGTIYQWFIDNVPSVTTRTQPVSTTFPGPFEYKVEVRDPITSCFVRDSLIFTINESPNFTAIPANTTACGANNGEIELTINSPAGSLFSYSITGVTSGTNLNGIDLSTGPVPPFPFTGLPADTYVIQVSDQVSGCAITTSIGISDIVISITSATPQAPRCDPVAVDIVTSGITDFAGANYIITNSGTGTQIGPLPFSSANFTTAPVPVPGSYTIQVNAVVQGCVATFNFSIVSDPQVPILFTPDLCNAQVTAVAAGATFLWSSSPVGGINGAANNAIVMLNPGTWNLTVVATDGVLCPGTGIITVSIDPPITADFTQSEACEDQVTLSATPTGPFTYLWQNLTTGATIIGGSSIIVNASDNFTVQVRSVLTGCLYISTPKQVFVAGDLQITMATTTPCIGTQFTLTGTSNIAGTNFQWGVDGNDISGATLPTLNRTTAGLYKLTGTIPGCSEFIEQQIILFPVTAGSLPNRALICNLPENPQCIQDPSSCELILDAGPDFQSYQWYQGGVISAETEQFFLVTEPAIYSVDLVNFFGCPSTDQTIVEEECKAIIAAPTAFRPGSSVTANSTFYVFTYFVASEDFQIFLFNRWGELVYQSTGLNAEGDQSQQWNGGYNNNASQILPAGTYSYVIKYRSIYRPEDGVQEQRGGVVLLR